MQTLEYVRPTDVADAVATVSGDPAAAFLAGGTTQVDLLLKDGALPFRRLVDITRLPLRGVTATRAVVRVGALTTMDELANDETVATRLPVLREALLQGASAQLRNMATIGGNLLQRTRCRYFRDPTVPACNKRAPGSGCAALDGAHRMHAILGTSDHCIAVHPSDLCVALAALDAVVHVQGTAGERTVPFNDLYALPGDRPDVETVLAHGDLVTAVDVPLLPKGARSGYLKVRDRASFEFAVVSVAAAVVLDGDVVRDARLALGGVGTVPWRASAAEAVLDGEPASPASFAAAADAALAGATPRRDNAYKVELAKRAVVRALATVTGVAS